MSVALFSRFIREHHLEIKPVKSAKSTTTAKEAAEVHGVPAPNIIKSLVVKAGEEFLICLCPGDRRLNLEKLARKLGKKDLRLANAHEVKKATGHSIGGVPPFGHKTFLKTLIVEGFDADQPLWAAAGASNTNFKTTLSELKSVVSLVNQRIKDG